MDYFSVDDVREAIEERLRAKLTRREWKATVILLDIKVPFHLTDEDLDYDIPRIKEIIELLKIEPP